MHRTEYTEASENPEHECFGHRNVDPLNVSGCHNAIHAPQDGEIRNGCTYNAADDSWTWDAANPKGQIMHRCTTCNAPATAYYHDAGPFGAGTFYGCQAHAPQDATPLDVSAGGDYGPLAALRHHVTGAVERGEATAIKEIPTPEALAVREDVAGGWPAGSDPEIIALIEQEERIEQEIAAYRDSTVSEEVTGGGMTDETTCPECGLTFLYAPHLHECKHKGRNENPGTTWADECVAKVMS